MGTISNGFGQSNADTVLVQGSNLLIGSWNPGLAFDSTPFSPGTAPNQTFVFSNPGTGGVEGGSLGVDGSGNPVEAYWNLSSPPSMHYYYYGTGPPIPRKAGPARSRSAQARSRRSPVVRTGSTS